VEVDLAEEKLKNAGPTLSLLQYDDTT